MSSKGHLFVVGTPIGNLKDITVRAISTLKDVSVILAEDTRNSKKLLSAHGIQTKMMSYHEHSSEKESQKIVNLLLEGNNLALISDAGTPTISDPGYGLIRECIKHEIRIIMYRSLWTKMSYTDRTKLELTYIGLCGSARLAYC